MHSLIMLRAESTAHLTPLLLRQRHRDVCLHSLVWLAGCDDSDEPSLISPQPLVRELAVH